MKQKISGYHQDSEQHWVAELECGHGQHVRHDPPWMTREWVTTEEGRNSRLGTELNCKRCDEIATTLSQAILKEVKKTLTDQYEQAGISGLCEEGRFEFAISTLDNLPLKQIAEETLKIK